jgi:hypothetical protein
MAVLMTAAAAAAAGAVMAPGHSYAGDGGPRKLVLRLQGELEVNGFRVGLPYMEAAVAARISGIAGFPRFEEFRGQAADTCVAQSLRGHSGRYVSAAMAGDYALAASAVREYSAAAAALRSYLK